VLKLVAAKKRATTRTKRQRASAQLASFHSRHVSHTVELTKELERLTGLESRLTILGHLQRGGTPSAADRVLATRLGTACAEFLHRGLHGVMVAARGQAAEGVPLERVAGKKNLVPADHAWIRSARYVGTCLGD
jgi:6-phosphofructokinase 1